MDDTRSDIGIYNSLGKPKSCSDMINDRVQCSRFLIKRRGQTKSKESNRKFSTISLNCNMLSSSSINNSSDFSPAITIINKSPSTSVQSFSSESSFCSNIIRDSSMSDNLSIPDQMKSMTIEETDGNENSSIYETLEKPYIDFSNYDSVKISDYPLQFIEDNAKTNSNKSPIISVENKLLDELNNKDVINEAFKFLDDL
ncbi:hypothetical protein HELRODRAFT_172994 [Helobdella robusta]|uniref:Uncharacterized protein n=1 Tax=Helobdella robusta TaxID=6412 RepID=T1F691_HELRO|nr:hypothetical protein HELRODRAFT_172994 [Helobdella robusta]ESO03958.1 hypothetical protein HELRODRAFT_172994 [Helobdella robusta]